MVTTPHATVPATRPRSGLGEFLGAYAFFFVALAFLNEAQWLMTGAAETHFAIGLVTVGAAVVSAAIVLGDRLRITALVEGEPLVVQAIWKTVVYSAIALAVRVVAHWGTFALDARSATTGWRRFLDEEPWRVFWAVQVWYAALFAIFVTARDAARAIGAARVRRLFFGK
jgi:hypothetical protein